jgi:hypothetical protein
MLPACWKNNRLEKTVVQIYTKKNSTKKIPFGYSSLKLVMANPLPSKLSNAIRLQSLKYWYFGAKSTKFLEKVQNLALNKMIFQKFGPRADLGCPWLLKKMKMIIKKFEFEKTQAKHFAYLLFRQTLSRIYVINISQISWRAFGIGDFGSVCQLKFNKYNFF